MRRIVMSLAVVASFSVAAHAQTAEQIVARHVAARGGLAKFRALRSMKETGKLSGPGFESVIIVQMKFPHRFRMDLQSPQMAMTQGYDGATGWQRRGDSIEQLSGSSLANLEDQADMTGPLVDYKLKGSTIEYLGEESVGDAPCYKLRVTLKTTTVMTVYLDKNNYLEIFEQLEWTADGKPIVITETVGEYKQYGGLWFATNFVSGPKGQPQVNTLHIENVEVNPAIGDAVFVMPAQKPAAPQAKP